MFGIASDDRQLGSRILAALIVGFFGLMTMFIGPYLAEPAVGSVVVDLPDLAAMPVVFVGLGVLDVFAAIAILLGPRGSRPLAIGAAVAGIALALDQAVTTMPANLTAQQAMSHVAVVAGPQIALMTLVIVLLRRSWGSAAVDVAEVSGPRDGRPA
jgi:hypothetical protein